MDNLDQFKIAVVKDIKNLERKVHALTLVSLFGAIIALNILIWFLVKK